MCIGLTDHWLHLSKSPTSLMWQTARRPVLLLHCTQNGESRLSGPAVWRHTNTVLVVTGTVSMFRLYRWKLRQNISCW